MNDDSTADSAGDTCTDWYDDHPEDCRGQLDLDCGLDTTDASADLEDGPIPYN